MRILQKGLIAINVYIEGPDSTGKTTLAKWICQEYGLEYEHLTSQSPNTLEYHQQLMIRDGYVYDRFCMGEIIYSKIYGRTPKLTIEDCVRLLEKADEQGDLFIVLLSSDMEILKNRLRERGELNYLDEIDEQMQQYIILSAALQTTECSCFMVFDIADGYENLYNFVRKELDSLV